ncbi:hypothetical protein E2562_025859 [Oryza meyeriana var. granulata]|uniref:Uncharacterized protein n=1 Tax=Oryza meyeriana var. granulata TaxID=110450 RepID=A0A6G1C0S2_9ORYZ|nr:hypothetical protein E2562_025859 [Oryza meyeriana var. granulata]
MGEHVSPTTPRECPPGVTPPYTLVGDKPGAKCTHHASALGHPGWNKPKTGALATYRPPFILSRRSLALRLPAMRQPWAPRMNGRRPYLYGSWATSALMGD